MGETLQNDHPVADFQRGPRSGFLPDFFTVPTITRR